MFLVAEKMDSGTARVAKLCPTKEKRACFGSRKRRREVRVRETNNKQPFRNKCKP